MGEGVLENVLGAKLGSNPCDREFLQTITQKGSRKIPFLMAPDIPYISEVFAETTVAKISVNHSQSNITTSFNPGQSNQTTEPRSLKKEVVFLMSPTSLMPHSCANFTHRGQDMAGTTS